MKIIITCFLCATLFCTAQQFKIKGTVRNSSGGEALPFANVFTKDGKAGASTNGEGYYELKLRPGSYEILASYIGYKTVTVPVTVGTAFRVAS